MFNMKTNQKRCLSRLLFYFMLSHFKIASRTLFLLPLLDRLKSKNQFVIILILIYPQVEHINYVICLNNTNTFLSVHDCLTLCKWSTKICQQ